MTKTATHQSATATQGDHSVRRREIRSFLLLACVFLPIIMLGAIAAYGFIVWFMQLLFWGPPT